MRAWNSLEQLWQDLRYALRLMRRSPGFTAVAVLSLALGIGANTAIFSLMYTVMLRLLPVTHPEQLVELLHRLPREGHRGNSFTWQAWQDLRDHNHVLAALIAASPSSFYLRGDGLDPEKVDGEYVDGNFFPVLGMRAAIGRVIGPEDDQAALLSWSYWSTRFHADPGVLGKRIFVTDMPVTIVGVVPRGFVGWQLGRKQDIWLPIAMAPMQRSTSSVRDISVQLVGRLKPGVSLEQAHAELAGLDKRIVLEQAKTSTNPFTREVVLDLEPAGAGLTSPLREQYAKPLMVMMAVVALLLLIACINVASLLLARGAAREREMALRVSLGAGRFRLLRQVLTESVLLSAAGSLLGIVLAYFGTSLLARIITSPRPIEIQARPEAAVLVFTAAAGLLTGLLFGLAPALHASSSAPVSSLRAAGSSPERFRRLFGKSLVVTQVALSVVLLSAAGLFVRYLSNLENLDLGFHRDHILLVTLDAGAQRV
jgi:putative ABC transport system permease protein